MLELSNYSLVLGSGSPRRKQLMEQMGLTFTVAHARCKEIIDPAWEFHEAAQQLALQKANSLSEVLKTTNTILITSDTIVCTDNVILGKPADRKEALKMLNELSGNTHKVITGVCLKSISQTSLFHVETSVTFAKLTPGATEHYVDVYKPYDKAGAYGIQEWIGMIGVEHISGSYFNVMGLPTHRLYRELKVFIENY